MVYIVDRTVWPLSLPIRTTLANVVLITTLLHPFLTQTACGLCAHSPSSHVLCAPPTQPEVATTSMPKTFLSTWSSSVPLRIFSCEQLELWSQMELESCMNRRLSPLSMLAGWKTFLGGCHCFLAFLMATQHQLFHTSTLDDKKQPFEFGCADGQGPASRRGSHVYEVNDWLWNFGRPQPRVGGLSVSKTERIRRRSRSEASRRSWETRKARKMAADEI